MSGCDELVSILLTSKMSLMGEGKTLCHTVRFQKSDEWQAIILGIIIFCMLGWYMFYSNIGKNHPGVENTCSVFSLKH